MAGQQDLEDLINQLGTPMQAAQQPFDDVASEDSSDDEEPQVEPIGPPSTPGSPFKMARPPLGRGGNRPTPQTPSFRMPPPVNASPFRRDTPSTPSSFGGSPKFGSDTFSAFPNVGGSTTYNGQTWDPLPATPSRSTTFNGQTWDPLPATPRGPFFAVENPSPFYEDEDVTMMRGNEVLMPTRRVRLPPKKRKQYKNRRAGGPVEFTSSGPDSLPPCPPPKKARSSTSVLTIRTQRPTTYSGGMRDPMPPDPPKIISAPKRKDVEPAGMAQRIRYKIGRKIQGLASEICRLKDTPSGREVSTTVRGEGGRISLRDSRILQCMEEAKNLKADLERDGFAGFLAQMPKPGNHYLHAPVKPATMQWFKQNLVPQLRHEERTGVTQQYAGGSRQGYRYAK